MLNGTIEFGNIASISLSGNMALLGNKGGIITLLNKDGIKIHSVSYIKRQTKQQGYNHSFLCL
ncbi:MAG: hypothetical protein JRJ44_07315 [Deltaproteobacteria bacterium]|nr:hypothetical protein [Deltaproteobacteria bacterium]